MSGLRGAYVTGVRTARKAADRTGLLRALTGSRSPALRHLRTLFAVHDVADLAALDVAWWTYPAMRRVDAFLATRPDARVFEFGAGASTVWLGRRAARVDSVEHDSTFAGIVRELLADQTLPATVRLHAVEAAPATAASTARSGRKGHSDLEFDEYVATIDRVGGEFDVIVVDGRARVAAFDRALEHLAPGGLIVFDNINRDRYHSVLRHPGLRYELLRGATPALPYPTTTAVVSRV